MEGFLSLPRSAKGGLAVLLAVALLGWAIVAYSAKRQHADAKSRDHAIATLKSQEDESKNALAELETTRERLQATKAELETSQQAVAASHQEKNEIEARFADLKAELDDLRLQPDTASGSGQAQALFRRGSDAEAATDTDQAGPVDVETLRTRLTDSMTALSAKTATLQQKERDLSRAQTAAEEAAAQIESLEAAAEERDTLRERLTETMTKLSAKNATLQQQDRALAQAESEAEAMMAELDNLKAVVEERDALRARLTESMTELSARNATIQQNERVLAGLQSQLDQASASLESMSEDRALETSSLTAELDELKLALSEKEDAIAHAETEVARLQEDLAEAEQQLSEQRSLIDAQNVGIEDAGSSLAALKSGDSTPEAEATDIGSTTGVQQTVLRDLAAIKGELDETRAELTRQTALLNEKHSEIAKADTRLQTILNASTDSGSEARSLPRIPIADLNEDSLAILPIDPMQSPMPVQTKRGLRLSVVHFDLGSADLSPGGLRRARESAAWIKQQAGDEKIRLVGATDTIGTKADNMVLAKNRARSLLKVFAEEGIDPARIEVISMGEAGGSEVIGDQTAEPLNRCVGVFIGEG